MILGEKSERRGQSSFSFLENINFRKSLPRAPEFEYSPLLLRNFFKINLTLYDPIYVHKFYIFSIKMSLFGLVALLYK